ncbi:LrgB family protein [Gracilibacillus caseinilyticus]|uniref:LrgB family protein n=1 Tax=Gracilibacillus caseinilyticus TaxID=2932256 RepID=A0ABY4EWP9_9BACI|nr:LrgB family protein [Gracilibacillus caseinilyticus]UOQ48834.1 LrgB family protein [Gracilibacillus caseinilyticus]
MNDIITGACFFLVTILVFAIAKQVYKRIPTPFTLPIFLTSVFFVIVLLTTDFSYPDYWNGGKWIDQFLGPVVVALALPLYRQLDLIKRYARTILTGVFAGSVIGVLTGIIGAKLLGFKNFIIQTVAAKSVTTPVALSITDTAHGNLALAAVFVMIAGISGAMFGPLILRLCRITHPVARGIGIGTASHAIGTSKALELGELEGSVSALSMTISAVIVSFLVPLFLVFV